VIFILKRISCFWLIFEDFGIPRRAPLSSCDMFNIRDNERDKVEKLFITETNHPFLRPDMGLVIPCPCPRDPLPRDVMPLATEYPLAQHSPRSSKVRIDIYTINCAQARNCTSTDEYLATSLYSIFDSRILYLVETKKQLTWFPQTIAHYSQKLPH